MARDGGARQATPLPGAVRQNFEIWAQPVAQGEPVNVAREWKMYPHIFFQTIDPIVLNQAEHDR
jgi:hypothetical protein